MISLCGAFGLQAAESSLLYAEKDVWIETSDSKDIVLSIHDFPLLQEMIKVRDISDNKDPARQRLMQLGTSKETALISHIDSNHWRNVFWLINEPDYVLPITEKEQETARTGLPSLLWTLRYLQVKEPVYKLYGAWLNHPKNIKKKVRESGSVKEYLEEMDFSNNDLSDFYLMGKDEDIELKKEHREKIKNYLDRFELDYPDGIGPIKRPQSWVEFSDGTKIKIHTDLFPIIQNMEEIFKSSENNPLTFSINENEQKDFKNKYTMPLNASLFHHAQQLCTDQNYQLPITKQGQEFANITLEGLVNTLYFLDIKKPIQKIYCAWLNHPSHLEKPLLRSKEKVFTLLAEMGINCSSFSNVLLTERIELDCEDTQTIQRYYHRKKGVSIQNLIDSGRMPSISLSGDINFLYENIISLDGLQNIGNKEKIINLNLQYNNIIIIKEHVFDGLEKLKTLNLRHNKITAIKENAFVGLNALKGLDLRNNEITAIKENSFAGLNALEELDLSNNNIKTIKENAFVGLNELTTLNLIYNRIVAIKENSFTGLNALEKLDLKRNNITDIKENSFAGLNTLIYLDLRYNDIATIKENSFAGLNTLEGLSLSYNKITILEKKAFSGLSTLTTLNLGYNKIIGIKENAFTELSILIKLLLSNNEIVVIEKNAFSGLNALKKLYLRNTNLTQQEKDTLKQEVQAIAPDVYIQYYFNLNYLNIICYLNSLKLEPDGV